MIMKVLKDFVDSNDLPQNASTRTSSIQTAIAAVIYTSSRKEALTMCSALSEFFAIIRDDDLGTLQFVRLQHMNLVKKRMCKQQ